MRILGFSKEWPKFEQGRFTIFRFPRKDKDWQVGESVQVVIKPRSKDRKYLGVAEIIEKDSRHLIDPLKIFAISEAEAVEDGFKNYADMLLWFKETHKGRIFREWVNKLTLEWRGRRLK